ncbi:5'-nucleotidase [Schaalia sp. JY-X159]|uniref:5'-nucleotidase n=1 Tax=Schaalia sp. JY-X159 TaxID=2758575 RepID=UPI0029343832|nr:5'-nucleotidase [Schaalia sp. JY-X159]
MGNPAADAKGTDLRIAFDSDGVLADDSSERIMQNEGLDAFRAHESVNLYEPLPAGRLSEFLGGIDKGPFLKVLLPHIFFDDQTKNLIEAAEEIPSVHIPFGVANATDSS